MAEPTPMLRLPLELHHKIIGYIRHDDDDCITEIRLSLTCQFYFRLLHRRTYARITFREDARTAGSLLAIADGPRADLVRHITFQPRDPYPIEHRKHSTDIVLSTEAREALGSLNQFPNISSFTFGTRWDVRNWSKHPYHYFDRGSCLTQAEDKEPWRELLNSALLALAECDPRSLKCLVIGRLPPFEYSALESDKLNGLLNHVDEFRLLLLNGSEDDPLRMTGYHRQLISKFDCYFFQHLRSVQSLCIEGEVSAMVIDPSSQQIMWRGWARGNWERTAIFPKLRELEIDYYLIRSEFVEFLVRHTPTIERIRLNHCYNVSKWNTLFDSMVASNPQRLVSFEILPINTRNRMYSAERKSFNYWTDPDLVRLVDLTEKRFADGEIEGGRVFPRGGIDEDTGELQVFHSLALVELGQGISLAAWRGLQDIISRNRRQSSDPATRLTSASIEARET